MVKDTFIAWFLGDTIGQATMDWSDSEEIGILLLASNLIFMVYNIKSSLGISTSSNLEIFLLTEIFILLQATVLWTEIVLGHLVVSDSLWPYRL